ncbi:MAG: hypothetical protein JW730_02515 [Anaerolineales bacterium]|nr:hypothetical protein [Anaerolineales bacterium]
MARKIGNPLTSQKEIAANQRGQITKYQQSKLGGVFWDKKQFWFGMVLFGLFSTIGPLTGVVWILVSGRSDADAWPWGLPCVSASLFVLWLLPSALIYLRWRRLEQNLAHEAVAQGTGTVSWERKRYVLMLADGKKLDPIYSPDLLPGRYRFYYLPRYRWLLTAEPLEEVAQADDLEQLNHRLARANHFLSTALDANRAGHLTGSQRVRILGRFAVYFIGGLGTLALFSVYYIRTYDNLDGLWVFLTIVMGMVVASAFVMRKSLSSIVDCIQGRVIITEGAVKKDQEVATDNSVSYYYKLNKSYFYVNEAGYEALVAGPTYRLYLLPRSRKLVNIEAIADTT